MAYKRLTLCFCLVLGASALSGEHSLIEEKEPSTAAPSIVLPKLLTKDFFSLEHICRDAQANGKQLALVGIKSHLCDCEKKVQFCMHIARNLSDPCNVFLSKHFSLYHSRHYRYPKFTDGECEDLPWGEFVSEAWQKIAKEIGPGPGVYVVDTKACKLIAKISSGQFSRAVDPEKRRAATKKDVVDALKTVKNPSEAVKKAIAETALTCGDKDLREKAKPSLEEVWNALEEQTKSFLPKPTLKSMPKK